MGSTLESIGNIMKLTRNAKETKCETCGELRARIRVGFPIGDRAFELRFAKLCGRNFATNRICTKGEIEKMEAAYPIQEDKMKRGFETPEPKVVPAALTVKKQSAATKAVSKWAEKVIKRAVEALTLRNICLLSALIIATIASVSNTLKVSHALSGDATTGLAITGVASAIPILFLFANSKGLESWVVVLLTLGFEAFCNAASVFNTLMGSMAYLLTTVVGKPSPFLDMVAYFTNCDHADLARILSCFVASMILIAQVSSLWQLKK